MFYEARKATFGTRDSLMIYGSALRSIMITQLAGLKIEALLSLFIMRHLSINRMPGREKNI